MNFTTSVNLSRAIDERSIGRFQITTFVLCACVAFLDGLDSQSIGVAAPFIAKGLHLDKGQIGYMFSAAVLGAVVSAMLLGSLADRVGRKPVLIGSVILIGVGTIATAYAWSFEALLAWRALSGVGLGGAVPCFIALASEYSPRRRRATITSLLWAAFPLGGMIGGFTNAAMLRYFDWHVIFLVGGAAPLVLAVVLAVWLPESARFLVKNNKRQPALARLIARLELPSQVRYVMDDERQQGAPFRRLFAEGRATATALLSLTFFTSFGALAVTVLWVPVLLRADGMAAADTAIVIGFHGLGALIGMAIVGRLIERFGGSRVLVPALIAGAAATAATGVAGGAVLATSVAVALIGLFVGLGASGAIALAVLFYPADMRSTGTGWSMGMGRLGQVITPILIGALTQHGLSTPEVLFALACAPALGALAVVAMGFAHLLPTRRSSRDATELVGH